MTEDRTLVANLSTCSASAGRGTPRPVAVTCRRATSVGGSRGPEITVPKHTMSSISSSSVTWGAIQTKSRVPTNLFFRGFMTENAGSLSLWANSGQSVALNGYAHRRFPGKNVASSIAREQHDCQKSLTSRYCWRPKCHLFWMKSHSNRTICSRR